MMYARLMSKTLLAGLVLLVACGDDGGAGGDAGISAPAMITVTGTVTARSTSSMPLEGVMLGAYRNSDESTPLATATSDAQGNYTLVIPTGGQALDGYIKGTLATYLDSYLYPPYVVAADFDGASINMITSGTLDLLANTLCGADQVNTTGVIAVIVADAAEVAVAGAAVASTPAASKVCYNQDGFPNRNATVTDDDGIAYLFNVTGQATVSATKSGTTFQAHGVNARAGTFTTTLITP